MTPETRNPEPEVPGHVTIGDEAAGIIRGPRAKFYGPPWHNLKAIGDAWQAYLSTKLQIKVEITPHDVCNLMVLLKSMRAAQGYHRDSAVDIIGYALLDEILEDEVAREEFSRDILGLYEEAEA